MSYRATSIRVLFLATHLTAVVLLSAYSAGLISSLTIDNKNLPFRTFEELLNVGGTYMAGVVNNSAAIGLFSVGRNSAVFSVFLPVPPALDSAVTLTHEPDGAVSILLGLRNYAKYCIVVTCG
jgi:hypothetical protein